MQIYLNKIYIKCNQNNEKKIPLIGQLANYYLDLESNLQINIKDTGKVRPFKIEVEEIFNNQLGKKEFIEKEVESLNCDFEILFIFKNLSQEKSWIDIIQKNLQNEKIYLFNTKDEILKKLNNSKINFIIIIQGSLAKELYDGNHIKNQMNISYIIYCIDEMFHKTWTKSKNFKCEILTDPKIAEKTIIQHLKNKHSYKYEVPQPCKIESGINNGLYESIYNNNDIKNSHLNISNEIEKSNFIQSDFTYEIPIDNEIKRILEEYLPVSFSMLFDKIVYEIFKKKAFSVTQSKKDFFTFCQENYIKYQGTQNDLNNLIEHVNNDNLIDENILIWFKKSSFFYPIIKSTLKDQNFCKRFKCRYAINNLKDAFIKFPINEKNIPEYLYKYEKIQIDELKKINEKKNNKWNLMALREFTSLVSEIPNNILLENEFFKKNTEKFVVLKIKVCKENACQIYELKNTIDYSFEKEFLLDSNVFLQIDSIEKPKSLPLDHILNCSLVPLEKILDFFDNEKLKILNEFSFDIIYENDYFYLTKILNTLELYSDEVEILKKMVNENDKDEQIKLYYLANSYVKLGNFTEAEKSYSQSLLHAKQIYGINHPITKSIKSKIEDLKYKK